MRGPISVPRDAHAAVAVGDLDPDQVGVVARGRVLGFDHPDPALLGHLRRIDGVDLLLGATAERADQRLDHQQARVALGQPAEAVDLDPLHGDALTDREHDRDRAERAAQRQIRAEYLEVLGRDRRHVDRAGDDSAGERRHHLLRRLKAGPVGRLRRRCAEVRGDDHVRVAEQRMLGHRLGAEHVERGAGDLAAVERRLEILVDDQRAAGDVEHPDAVLALGQHLSVQPALGVGRLRKVDRQEVGHGIDIVGRFGALGAKVAVALGPDERVVGDDPHAEPTSALGDELSDPAEAEDPQRLLVQLGAGELGALPLAGGQRRVRLRNVARERQQQRHRVLGGRDHV